MCSDKSNIYPFDCKLDNYDKPMIIASNIKHIMLIADIINTVETFLNICITLPPQFTQTVIVNKGLLITHYIINAESG